MTYILVFVGGVAAEYLFGRWVLRFLRKDGIRKDVFARMTYDALLKFKKAVEEELASRQP